MSPEMEQVPPCRILMQDSKPVDLVVTERPRRAAPRAPEVAPKRQSSYIPTVSHYPIGRPRVDKPKHKPTKHPGSGQGSNRLHNVTVAAIERLQAEGKTALQIAMELGCTRYTIFGRLRDARRKAALKEVA